MTGFLRFKRKEEIAVASEIKRRFTDTEMQIVRETDLLELLTHLGYQVKRIGRYHTTAEMDSLRIKDRRTWFRYHGIEDIPAEHKVFAFPQLSVREQMAAYKEIIDGSSLEGYRKIAKKEHEER